MNDAEAWAGVAGAGGFFLLLIVVVWQIAATWRSRMRGSHEREYREMARKYQQLLEDNVAIQQRTLDELIQTRQSLTDVTRSLEKARERESIRELG